MQVVSLAHQSMPEPLECHYLFFEDETSRRTTLLESECAGTYPGGLGVAAGDVQSAPPAMAPTTSNGSLPSAIACGSSVSAGSSE